ncbi:MAG: hypothetical protein WCT26_02700 [Candidatus Buchananbacteria bacterium]|jgi:hypothetical protein
MNKIDIHKLILPVSVLLGCIILGSIYYVTEMNKQQSIERQQKLDIQQRQEELRAEQEIKLQTQNNVEQTYSKPIDGNVKIELCQTEAKSYADKLAKEMYLKAYNDALAKGDTATAQAYLNFSFKPEHPADYDNNYSSVYTKCLQK